MAVEFSHCGAVSNAITGKQNQFNDNDCLIQYCT